MSLTADQLEQARELDKGIRKLLKLKEELSNYKLGDVYLMEFKYDHGTSEISKNHLGFPIKYKVVYISAEGIPYLRRLTPAGKPTGSVEMPHEAVLLSTLARMGHINTVNMYTQTFSFIPDPEQLDSILLQEDYDPTADHREKAKVFNEITKHNKKIAIKTGHNDFKNIGDFFKSLKPGDKFWMGYDKVFVFQKLEKVGREWEITTIDNNQQEKKFNFTYFHYKRLYRDQPRSFAKEAKP